MIEQSVIFEIEKLLDNKKIIYSKLLSDSFGINCLKIFTSDRKEFIVKYYYKNNDKFNAIKSETDNLLFFNNQKFIFFPSIINHNDKFLIMSFIDNNVELPDQTNDDLLNAIISLHSINSANYGFNFDTQIGGLKQINTYSKNWREFYTDNRLSYIFDLVNKKQPMDREINTKIDLLIKKIDNFIPNNPRSSLLHGDLWVWAGVGKHQGKDFAATGSIFGNGEAYFWDVSDPSNMKIIDTVTVDARNVNDVKVSTDGKIGVISREGASNRKNGFVILDVSDPYNVKIISAFNDDMTGGVHNTFIYDNHVYAVNNGRKYDVINIEDPKNPFRVGVFELDTPGHALHDVWVENGIAYSSNWRDGVVAVDVGGLKFNEKDRSEVRFNPLLMKSGKGKPSNPVKLASFPDRKGRNHSAFPFLSESTGDFFIIAGDEVFPNGLENLINNKPSSPRGGFHFINFNDPDNPKEDAVYIVPEAGSHNQWVYGDRLLAAFYQAGIRILDISGELLGDLYKQGREIGYFLPQHRDGIIPNAPMVWGAQPYKNYIFLSDMNSGLYCIEIVDKNNKSLGTP